MKCASCQTALDSRATFCPNCGATVVDPLLHTHVGNYSPYRRIAIGTFGSIYEARDLVLDESHKYAMKVMHPELADDRNLVERFQQEGKVLTALFHPNIVRTKAYGETDRGLPYIVMELLDGETLLDAFRAAKRLPWPYAFSLGAQVCAALEAAHSLGVVHRDLKPGNIFVTRAGVAKVLDFGIAKILSNSEVSDPRELTRMGTTVGTLEYMAPEQLMGGRADPRADIYALGVVLYEVITGRRPFNATGLDLLTEQLSQEVPLPSTLVEVPAEVDQILIKCLQQDIDDRFRSALDLARAIEAALAAHAPPKPASPSPSPSPLPSPSPFPPPSLPTERPVLDTEPIRKQSRIGTPVLIAIIVAVLAAAAVAISLL